MSVAPAMAIAMTTATAPIHAVGAGPVMAAASSGPRTRRGSRDTEEPSARSTTATNSMTPAAGAIGRSFSAIGGRL